MRAQVDAKASGRQEREEAWRLDSDKKKAPGSSAEVRGSRRKRRQTEQENIPQQEAT
jgi:hypothetical protein